MSLPKAKTSTFSELLISSNIFKSHGSLNNNYLLHKIAGNLILKTKLFKTATIYQEGFVSAILPRRLCCVMHVNGCPTTTVFQDLGTTMEQAVALNCPSHHRVSSHQSFLKHISTPSSFYVPPLHRRSVSQRLNITLSN